MYEKWQNGQRTVNGAVRSPLVLRSEAEMIIAQNAHNLIWDRHWDECEALDVEIEIAGRMHRDDNGAKARLQAVFDTVKAEIDELIIGEIAAYREEQAAMPTFFDVEKRFARIEQELMELKEKMG